MLVGWLMIDLVFISLPVIIIGIAAFRVIRHVPWDTAWQPPSSRLSLLGVGSTLALLGRWIMTHKPWYGIFSVVAGNVCMISSYRIAARSEAHHKEYLRRQAEE